MHFKVDANSIHSSSTSNPKRARNQITRQYCLFGLVDNRVIARVMTKIVSQQSVRKAIGPLAERNLNGVSLADRQRSY